MIYELPAPRRFELTLLAIALKFVFNLMTRCFTFYVTVTYVRARAIRANRFAG